MTKPPDLSEFETLSQPRRLECGVKTVLDQLKAKDAAAAKQLEAALIADRTRIAHTAVAAWADLRGLKLRADTVRRHRTRQCSCHA